jgi:PhnB protein
MATFNPYLHFTGNTEEAFNFYKSVLGGEFIKTTRYKDLPKSDEHTIPEAFLEKIMHIALPLGKNNILMGSDAMLERDGQKFTYGDNFHISITAESKEEANKLYNGLSVDGKIEMPMEESPWGSYFGMFADKFGVQWTVDFDPNYNGEIVK